jgi:hypothetical protein
MSLDQKEMEAGRWVGERGGVEEKEAVGLEGLAVDTRHIHCRHKCD